MKGKQYQEAAEAFTSAISNESLKEEGWIEHYTVHHAEALFNLNDNEWEQLLEETQCALFSMCSEAHHITAAKKL